jgi:flagellar basal body-associated protein FliL
MKLIVATLLAIVVGFSSAVAEESNNVAHGDKTVGKVVKMLKDMLKNGKKDADKDRKVYAKFKCYCDDNEAKKDREY